MIEDLKSDKLIKKIGGPFRLTALVQRRLKELVEGARPLVDSENKNMIQIAVEEIAQDKIDIDYDTLKDVHITAPEKSNKTSPEIPNQD